MTSVLTKLKRYVSYTSWPIPVAMLSLLTIGLSAIRVSEQAEGVTGIAAKQATFAGIGLAAFVVMLVIPYRKLGRLAYGLFALTLVLLVLLVVLPRVAGGLGVVQALLPDIRGAHRWIDLGPVQVQPSEFAKLAFILMLAWYLRDRTTHRTLRGLLTPLGLTLVPVGLILIEPDLGTSLLLLPTLLLMLFMAGAKLRHLLALAGLAAVLVLLPVPRPITGRMSPQAVADRQAVSYFTVRVRGAGYVVSPAPVVLMKPHQVRRIKGWLRQGDPQVVQDEGYQLHQSKMILGAGKATGRQGWLDADTAFRMVPDDHTDFIFSIVGGQWGFVGCVAVLGLYGVILLFGVEIASVTHDAFGRLVAVGVLAMLFSQVVINVGMTMGLMPITGMTLPLISYGGSSVVVNCAALGLLVNVGQRRPILLARRPFEHGRRKEKPPAPYGPFAKGPGRDVIPPSRGAATRAAESTPAR